MIALSLRVSVCHFYDLNDELIIGWASYQDILT